MDSNIINYPFLRSTASCISKLAVKGYIEDLQSYPARSRKQTKAVIQSDDTKGNHAKDHPKINHEQNDFQENQSLNQPQSIFELDSRNKSIILQTTTLLQGLLKQGFPAKPEQLFQLQISDLKIRDIFDSVQEGKTKQFV